MNERMGIYRMLLSYFYFTYALLNVLFMTIEDVVDHDFDEAVAEDDSIVEKDGVKVVVDAMSYPYLVGAKVDYEEGLQGSKFVIQNPNAASTCGCGSSFSM